jgi:secreted PhoX family phosphatase
MAASLELGQPPATAFTSGSSSGFSATSLGAPFEVKFDPSGNLWVADAGYNRVLEYNPPFSNGMAATTVLGQGDFTHGDMNQNDTNTPAADTMSSPTGLAFDSTGILSVSDDVNSRILRFAPPFTTGMKATGLIGQANFTTGSTNQGSGDTPSAFTLDQPLSLSAY